LTGAHSVTKKVSKTEKGFGDLLTLVGRSKLAAYALVVAVIKLAATPVKLP